MKRLTPLILVLLCGCATGGESSGALDYAHLLKAATPTFTKGECGPEVTWRKTLQVHEEVEVEGVVIVKKRCENKEEE